ncbi:response regulator [Paenibacillus gansuensis]|uniref:Response regulator transcription factor n=1 Tax=Paenibacillus gansuensis TaxID=306542 RepID=A0ABW5PKS8_9BACL
MYRVVIADDHAMARQGLRMLLSGCPDFSIVGEAVDGNDAMDQSIMLKPELVLTDLKMPGCSMIEGTRQLKRMYPDIKVIILTALDESEDIYKAKSAGVDGYLSKDTDPEVILGTVRSVMSGRSVYTGFCGDTGLGGVF